MSVKSYIENKIFHYDGPFSSDDGVIRINCKFKIKPKGYIELYWLGEKRNYLDIEVEIFEMTPVSAYLLGEYLKDVEDRQVISYRFYYFSTQLKSIANDFLEGIGKPHCSISSIKYTGDIPTSLE